MTEEHYKHSHDSPSGRVVDLKIREDVKQSYLAKSDMDNVGFTISATFFNGLSWGVFSMGLISGSFTLKSWNLVGMLFIVGVMVKSQFDNMSGEKAIKVLGDEA